MPSDLAVAQAAMSGKKTAGTMRVSAQMVAAAPLPAAEVLERLGTRPQGLTDAEAAERLERFGRNAVGTEKGMSWWHIFFKACVNPLVILLLCLSIVMYLTGDLRGGTVMMAMVVLGVGLRFVQEAKADNAAAKLKAMIRVTATVLREGAAREVPLGDVVPGDIVKLAAGDMIPGDLRLLVSKDLFVAQASLTGESLPVEKNDVPTNGGIGKTPLELPDLCFMGTSVESGSATAVVVETGATTYLGGMAKAILQSTPPTAFDKGIASFTWLMIRFMAVMVPLVFIINVLTKGDPVEAAAAHGFWEWMKSRSWTEAFFFSVAVAVGLTPEMLPMIVSVCLSKGAIAMSRKKVIVKKLPSIQNFGAMDVLCTDKTGTLTRDHVILERHCDVAREDSDDVLLDAYTISYYQTGLKNVLDRAILDHEEVASREHFAPLVKIDEIPFDFQRKMMSVVIENKAQNQRRILVKGAPEAVFERCVSFEINGEQFDIDPVLIEDLEEEYRSLSADGFRVLAVAYRDVEAKAAYTKEDERKLVLRGYVAFLDPPKDSAAPAIAALRKYGVDVKVLTGDNDLVSRKVCTDVGLDTKRVVLGSEVEAISDLQLEQVAEEAHVFARLSPAHKQRIIKALQKRGHVVGFMGDGINDAPALRAADVGISVDTAVDIAKESADVILLEKSLLVLEEGVLEGRKVFANITKYVRMGASSNFGNMFSVLGASIFVPFLPMLPIQILSNNLLYDFSQVPIPTDEVDAEQIRKPMPWSMSKLARFITLIGPCSSVFDYTTYLMMLFVFKTYLADKLVPPAELAWQFAGVTDVSKTYAASLFQTGWFVESLLTQTLIIHIIRTNRIPFIQSRASWPLVMTTVAIMAIGIMLPYSPLAHWLGFVPLPGLYWPLIMLSLLLYCILTQGVKMLLLRKAWL